jgi:hypothetical protein
VVDPAQIFGDFRIELTLGIERPAGREAHEEKRKGDDDEQRWDRRRDTRKKKTKHYVEPYQNFAGNPSPHPEEAPKAPSRRAGARQGRAAHPSSRRLRLLLGMRTLPLKTGSYLRQKARPL